MNRLFSFLRRAFSGEDMVMVRQSPDAWNRQFEHGRWNRLVADQPNTERVAALVREQSTSKTRVLDVGCGNGGLARLIADAVSYTGVDISSAAIAEAKRLASAGTFLAADAEAPPRGLGVFDILVFNEVFFYINPSLALPRYRAHASQDALVVVSIVRSWRSWFLWRRVERWVRVMRRVSVRDDEFVWDIAVGHFLP